MFKHLSLISAAILASTAAAHADDVFFEDFASESGLYDNFTILNLNNDDNTWRWYGGEIFCHCHSSLDMDDWLITPVLRLEAGRNYVLSFHTWATNSKYTERLEVCLGQAPDVEAMTTTLMPPSDITELKGARTLRSIDITPQTSGTYYIGFHGISPRNRYNLYLDDIRVSAGEDVRAPAAIADLAATPDPTGLDMAVITLTAPDKAFDGSALSALTAIEIMRDGVTIATFDNPRPGAPINHTDRDVPTGTHTWTALARNAQGSSQTASAAAFVGPNLPLQPDAVNITETATPGKVNITWTPVTRDIDGKQLADGMITYTLLEDEHIIAHGLRTPSYTTQIVPAGSNQEFVSVSVYAETASGACDPVESPIIPVGRSYTLPFAESFPAASFSTAWAIQNVRGSGYGQWKSLDDSAGIPSQDGDDGLVAAYTPVEGDITRLISAKVDLKGADAPVLQTYYYNIKGGHNKITLLARAVGSDTYQVIDEYTNTSPEGWRRIIAPVDMYAGKTIQFAIQTEMVNQYHSIFDNIRIFNLSSHDLRAASINAPRTAKVGDDITISIGIENNGADDAHGVTVTLFRNDRPVAVSQPVDIPLLADATISVTDHVEAIFDETTAYRALINYDPDIDPADNATPTAIVRIDRPLFPAPLALEASANDSDITLTWTAPDISSAPVPARTDDFENFESGTTTDFADWTLIDGDGDPTYSIEGVDHPHAAEPMAFMIFDTSWNGAGTDDFAAHSGSKYAVCMAAGYGAPNDDWLISPTLTGNAQRVTFYARSLSPQYREEFEFMYSTTGTDPDDFRQIGFDSGVPARWTAYTYDLPDGARHFAIHCVSDDKFMLMVDDISFTPLGMTATPLDHIGYNIYRDGTRLNTAPLTTETFIDTAVPDGEHSYLVTALYDRGESVPSDEAYISLDGISDTMADAIQVTTRPRTLIIDRAAGLHATLHTTDGATVMARTLNAAHLEIPLPPGLYILAIDGRPYKIIIK